MSVSACNRAKASSARWRRGCSALAASHAKLHGLVQSQLRFNRLALGGQDFADQAIGVADDATLRAVLRHAQRARFLQRTQRIGMVAAVVQDHRVVEQAAW